MLFRKFTATLLAASLSAVGLFAQTAPKKSSPSKALAKPTTKVVPVKSGGAKAATVKAGAVKSVSAKTKGKVKPPPRYSGQMQPAPERYKEIQQALMDRGYFRGQVDGVWGSDSADALKRFQVDQNLDADGKIGSLSLIALGLGPRRGSKNDEAPRAQEPNSADVTPPPFTPPTDPPQDAN